MLANTGGFGLLAQGRRHVKAASAAAKRSCHAGAGDNLLPPVARGAGPRPVWPALSLSGHLLLFPAQRLKLQSNGGRGLTLMAR